MQEEDLSTPTVNDAIGSKRDGSQTVIASLIEKDNLSITVVFHCPESE
jgi:hypothetical protein